MSTYGYSIKGIDAHRAHASLENAPFSYKVGVLIGQRIKGMTTEQAMRFLGDVQTQKQAVPYTKFNDSVGHRPGMGPGRYPQKAAKCFEATLANAIANAEDKGLGKELWVEFVVTQQGSRNWRNRPSGRHKAKRSHIEIVVTSNPITKKVNAKKTTVTKTESAPALKKETKPAAKKEAAAEASQ